MAISDWNDAKQTFETKLSGPSVKLEFTRKDGTDAFYREMQLSGNVVPADIQTDVKHFAAACIEQYEVGKALKAALPTGFITPVKKVIPPPVVDTDLIAFKEAEALVYKLQAAIDLGFTGKNYAADLAAAQADLKAKFKPEYLDKLDKP